MASRMRPERFVVEGASRRALIGFLIGTSVALVEVVSALAIGDGPNDLLITRSSPSGISLFGFVKMIAVTLPFSAMFVAVLLPLYRYKYGGLAVGMGGILAFCVAAGFVTDLRVMFRLLSSP